MRFRRRPDAPPEPEPDERAWARPGEDQDVAPPDGPPPDWEGPPEVPEEAPAPDDSPYAPPPEADYEAVEEPAYEAVEEPAHQAVEEPVYEAVEEPAYEPVDEPAAYQPVEEATYLPAEEPLREERPPAASDRPVKRWSGGQETMVPSAEGTVRAAGGVVWSRWQGGLRVVVVHRPRYDDWSLPKGKAGPGESDAECALREVREETGLACSLGEDLGITTYYDRHGRLKTVRYYAMQPLGGGEAPQNEVDEVRWVGLEEAKRLLSYERDVDMLNALVAMAARRELPEEPPAG